MTFSELNINPSIMRAITEMGYETPSPIQAEALPHLLGEPTDFLGLAATGTGKTAAFAIPLLQRINPHAQGVQALVLCPTRELALQVAGQINLLGKHLGIRTVSVYGGTGYGEQINGLRRGANVVVGTPGRVVDHIEKGTLDLSELGVLVLDEADEMISMGFKDDLEAVLNAAPREWSNIWLFSATMSPEIRRVADEYLREPKMVQVNRTEILPESIEQLYYVTQESNKAEILCKLIDAADDFYGLIFCQTKALVVDLTQYLTGRGYRADCLHGDMDQNARERTMQAYRDRRVKLLVCTDVASRGLDVKDVTHVINYSVPRELESYVHRIGRTARSGKTGYAMSLITPAGRGLIQRIERVTKRKMKEGKVPTRKEIGLKKVAAVLTKFQEQPDHARAVEVMGDAWKLAVNAMSTEEITGRFLAMMYPELFLVEREAAKKASTDALRPMGKKSVIVDRSKSFGDESDSDGQQPAKIVYPKSVNRDAAPRKHESPWRERRDEGGHGFKEKRSFGGAPGYGGKPAFGKSFDKPFKKSFNRDEEGKSFGGAPGHGGGERKFGKKFGDSKPAFGGKPFGGKPSYGSKKKFSGTVGKKPKFGFDGPLTRG